ncbi:ribonuclease P subunit p25 [Olea europaea subsp. europaea]|uniref:Ribonuclease P subunit p25 n=1 Tax=Olea europaea subsp. europaea TaxID=158383 RepID=A0A8S0V0I1_OLEEU|nr:ribonuclease P subunit p25 [Olea europaea subsp. europaea]
MDRYQKVEKPKPESPINENEIRITSQGLVRNYISYATALLQERRGNDIVLKAMGQAISKTVAIAEIIKRRIPRLHQDTAISSLKITDTFEPIEEGLETVEQTRHVSMISITLSTKELNKNSPGYQAPAHMEQSKQQYNYKPQPQQQQPPRQVRAVFNSGNGDAYGRGRARNRGRGGGRGGGWNRGGYANYQENDGYANYQGNGGYANYKGNGGYANNNVAGNGGYANNKENDGYANYQENGGYSNWGRGGGRGGGWGYRGSGYGRGRGGGGRGYGYGRGRGRMGGRSRGGGGGNLA